jgi:hypothetical protein
MRKFVIAIAAIAAAGIALPITAPANAQDRTVIIKRDGDRDFDRPRTTKKVIIHRGDRGNHYGWRNRDRDRGSSVVIRRSHRDNVGFRDRHEGRSKTVIIKKRSHSQDDD